LTRLFYSAILYRGDICTTRLLFYKSLYRGNIPLQLNRHPAQRLNADNELTDAGGAPGAHMKRQHPNPRGGETMQRPFDTQLAKTLGDLRRNIEAQQKSLYQARRECACDSECLCAHHADIFNQLTNAMQRLDSAIKTAQDPSR
jgi:hypothetical protein